MADQVRVQGVAYDRTSCQLKIDGQPFFGWTAVTYDEKRTRGKQWGSGKAQVPRGRTRGKYEPGALKITMWKDSAAELRKQLAAKAADEVSYGNVEVPVVLQYVEENADPITLEWGQAVIASKGVNENETDPSKEDVEFDVMYHKENGLTLFDNTEGLY